MQSERELWTQIIEMYKARPHMWDKTHIDYFNKELRQKGYKLMYDIYKEYSDVEMAVFKKKFENMRTSHSRELKKVIASRQSGSEVYKPCLWYFDLFSIHNDLKDEEFSEAPRNAFDAVDIEETSLEYEPAETVQYKKPRRSENWEEESRRHHTKLKINPHQQQQQEHRSYETLPQVVNSNQEEWDIIGRGIGLELKRLSHQQQIIAKKLISDTIFYGNLGKLTENTTINLNNQCTNNPAHVHQSNSFSDPFSIVSIKEESLDPQSSP